MGRRGGGEGPLLRPLSPSHPRTPIPPPYSLPCTGIAAPWSRKGKCAWGGQGGGGRGASKQGRGGVLPPRFFHTRKRWWMGGVEREAKDERLGTETLARVPCVRFSRAFGWRVGFDGGCEWGVACGWERSRPAGHPSSQETFSIDLPPSTRPTSSLHHQPNKKKTTCPHLHIAWWVGSLQGLAFFSFYWFVLLPNTMFNFAYILSLYSIRTT